MNKFFFVILCVIPSFVSSMNNTPTKLSTIQPDIFPSRGSRSRMRSDPIVRVKGQASESPRFVQEENSPMFKKEKELYKIGQESSDSNKK